MTWRLLYVRPLHEAKVVAALAEHRLTGFAPMERVFRNPSEPSPYKRGRMVMRPKSPPKPYARPLVPRYVFADIADADLPTVAHLDGVQHVLGLVLSRTPSDVAPFVEKLREAEAVSMFDHTQKREPFQPGARVRILSGPYAGMVTSIARMRSSRRVELVLQVFGNPVGIHPDKLMELPDLSAKAA